MKVNKQPASKEILDSISSDMSVPQGIPEKTPHFDNPYMGDLTSHQIGMMAKSGQLGGEMVKRMIKKQEEEMVEQAKFNESFE